MFNPSNVYIFILYKNLQKLPKILCRLCLDFNWEVSGLTILSEIDDIARFKDASHLASYVGIVPMCYSSGEHDGTGNLTVRRHAQLRWLIVESAWIAVRKDPVLSAAYVEYCRKMKPGKAIIKVARRIINRIYFVMKHQHPYVNCFVS